MIVLDEPTAQLDPSTAEAVVANALAAANGRSVVLITHGPRASTLSARS